MNTEPSQSPGSFETTENDAFPGQSLRVPHLGLGQGKPGRVLQMPYPSNDGAVAQEPNAAGDHVLYGQPSPPRSARLMKGIAVSLFALRPEHEILQAEVDTHYCAFDRLARQT